MARHTLAGRIATLALGMMACGLVAAQAQTAGLRPVQGERLSDWILRQPPQAQPYPLGLIWRVPAERPAQALLQIKLIDQLRFEPSMHEAVRSRWLSALQALPATGRVPLPHTDARWLQAHPRQDPILSADHRVILPVRPTTVTVVTQDGFQCTVPHTSQAQARDYLRACEPARLPQVDRAWVVQADGSVNAFGIAAWNEQAQDELAPGALIWAPSRQTRWAVDISEPLAQFLATQSEEDVRSVMPALPGRDRLSLPRSSLPARSSQLSASDWGLIGLLQTPTARMSPAGEARFHFSRVYPYERFNVFLQPFDELELGFRYTDIVNRLYGPESLSGKQTYKDKSIDFKYRLLAESAKLPQLAVGITDIGGTGFFSSEYVVASKRWGAWDWSLGVAWGYLGSSGNVGTPLGAIDQRFKVRGTGVATGGTPNASAFFRGPAALLGGVQYTAGGGQWLWKAELDGNNYQREPQGNLQKHSSPLNLGLVYRVSKSIDLSAALERGNRVMLGLTLHTSVAQMGAPKASDLPTPRVVADRPSVEPAWLGTAADVSAMSGWGVRAIERDAHRLRVLIDNTGGVHWDDRIDRIAAVLHRDAPAGIEAFDLVFLQQGIAVSERFIDRRQWVGSQTALQAPSERETAILPNPPRKVGSDVPKLWERTPSRFSYGIVPSWQQNLGGPDGFLLFRAGMAVPLGLKLTENTSITGTLNLNILDNFDRFKYTAPSNLPRVRTYLREYMTDSRVNVANLQISHLGSLSNNQFYSAYGGYLESMYGGVGGEWLYRPWHSPWAFGVDINRVQQRNFNQLFGFDRAGTQTGYRVTTGHATTYWDTGWKSTHVKLSVGRYLAADMGATLDVSRSFRNGVTIGGWATKTNISAEKFGEGSFDKGLYLRIPFDVMTTSRNASAANLVYNPLTRDGGARLNRSLTLYEATSARSQTGTSYVPAMTR